MYTELDVINACLATLGVEPLNQIDENRPFVGTIRKEFIKQRTALNSRGWWYNNEFVKLTPDAVSKMIYVPGDTISIGPLSPTGLPFPVVLRGTRLFNTATGSYEFTGPVECRMTRNLTYDIMPTTAKFVVMLRTQLAFQKNYDGDNTRYSQIAMELKEAESLLMRDEIKHAAVNMLYNSASATRVYQGMGGSVGRIIQR